MGSNKRRRNATSPNFWHLPATEGSESVYGHLELHSNLARQIAFGYRVAPGNEYLGMNIVDLNFGIPLECPQSLHRGGHKSMSLSHHKKSFLAMLVSLLIAPATVQPGFGQTPPQGQPKPKPAPAQQPPQPEEEYTEEEYDAYEKATKEPDSDKRQAALIAFMEKYPKSKLQQYIVHSYKSLLAEYHTSKNYAKLLPAAEQWLKYEPNDLRSMAYIADAAKGLGDDKKFVEYGQKIYAAKPVADMAYEIAQSFKKIGDQAKYDEWNEKTFSDPKYAMGEFKQRIDKMEAFVKEKNFAKAAESAQLVLKSLETTKKPDDVSEADWRKTITTLKRSCYYFIGVNYYDQDKYTEAIKSMEQALAIDKKFDWPYYYIALCQEKIAYSKNNLDMMEEAMITFAKAVLLKGEAANEAKERLERLYKPQHNNTLVGIERRYAKAANELGVKP
jgi:tetratricopeptide (TPR) repeat protein